MPPHTRQPRAGGPDRRRPPSLRAEASPSLRANMRPRHQSHRPEHAGPRASADAEASSPGALAKTHAAQHGLPLPAAHHLCHLL